MTWSHKLAQEDAVEGGIKSNNDLEGVVPKDENGHRSLAADRHTHRTDDTPTTRAC